MRAVQHLLLRFGVVTSLHAVRDQHRGAERTVHALVVEPASAHAVDVDAAARLGVPVRALAAAGRSPARAGRWRRATPPAEPPRSAGRPDVCWDEIVAITAAGDEQVYDLTVPGLANFVAADVVVHNTAFALGMATHVAVEAGLPVLFFSLEMGHAELTLRILSAEARVDSQKMRTGRLSEQDWSKIGRAIGRLEAPLFIDDNPNVTVMEIRAKARRLAQRYAKLGPDRGRLPPAHDRPHRRPRTARSRCPRSAAASRSWPASWRCPIVALSQLSRNLESRADKRPMLSDLRESGSIEQDADVVMFIYRDEVYNPESTDRGVAEIIVAKQRNGPIGTKRLVFLGPYTRFDNAAERPLTGTCQHEPGGHRGRHHGLRARDRSAGSRPRRRPSGWPPTSRSPTASVTRAAPASSSWSRRRPPPTPGPSSRPSTGSAAGGCRRSIRSSARIGRSGVSADRSEGDGTTPGRHLHADRGVRQRPRPRLGAAVPRRARPGLLGRRLQLAVLQHLAERAAQRPVRLRREALDDAPVVPPRRRHRLQPARRSCPAGAAPSSCTCGTRTPRPGAWPSTSTAWWRSCAGSTRPSTRRSPSAPTTSSSAADPEPGLARRLLVGHLDAGHHGAGRPDAAPRHHGQHGGGLALEHGLDPPVVAVAHPAAHAGRLRLAAGTTRGTRRPAPGPTPATRRRTTTAPTLGGPTPGRPAPGGRGRPGRRR